jgi:hypothetical protein
VDWANHWSEQVAIQQLRPGGADPASGARPRPRAGPRRGRGAGVNPPREPGPAAGAEPPGDMLELKRLAEARAEYRATLLKGPNRRHALRGAGG